MIKHRYNVSMSQLWILCVNSSSIIIRYRINVPDIDFGKCIKLVNCLICNGNICVHVPNPISICVIDQILKENIDSYKGLYTTIPKISNVFVTDYLL